MCTMGSLRVPASSVTLKSVDSALFTCTDMGETEPSFWKAWIIIYESLHCLQAVAKIIASAFSLHVLYLVVAA